ncbi:hypothetical protein CPB83DRAFT_844827 [Crepidotus variabilis]|uniref:Uncharacterized protein n=1 Tax=Crepidotus variabilis TaxID=179855 RepID=A0A9P6ER99_9AGAR|nr:hypothetical protein CPB83DRAFT_844827 [Crepidotus variabilis]
MTSTSFFLTAPQPYAGFDSTILYFLATLSPWLNPSVTKSNFMKFKPRYQLSHTYTSTKKAYTAAVTPFFWEWKNF